MQKLVSFLECIASVATAISLVFIVLQTKSNLKSVNILSKQTQLLDKTYQYTTGWQRKQRAVELSEYYRQNILYKVNYISCILKDTGVSSQLIGIRDADIQLFTKSELMALTSKNIEQSIESKLANPENIAYYIKHREWLEQVSNVKLHNINSQLIKVWKATAISKGAEKASSGGESSENRVTAKLSRKDEFLLVSLLYFEFSAIVTDTLNSLEYFAMNFVSGVADECVVYQSLHQMYFALVRALYFHIAVKNETPKDKFYTNVIQLYHIWNTRDLENGRKCEEAIHTSPPVVV